MGLPNFPTNTPSIKATILNMVGRDVTFMTIYSSQACPDCSLDPVTNTSTDSECLTCSGVYWIPLWSGDIIKAHVTWKYSDQTDWETVGKLLKGDCQIKIMYSGNSNTVVENAEYVIVDGRIMDIEDITYRGITVLDRILIDLKEREKE